MQNQLRKFVEFLYINSKIYQNEIKKDIPLIITREKYLEINLSKEVKTKNYRLDILQVLWEKLQKTEKNGKSFFVRELEEVI